MEDAHNIQKPIEIDKNTFGGSKAAEVLALMLNKHADRKMTKKVSHLWTYYSQGIHNICRDIKDRRFRDRFLQVWYVCCVSSIEQYDWPEKNGMI